MKKALLLIFDDEHSTVRTWDNVDIQILKEGYFFDIPKTYQINYDFIFPVFDIHGESNSIKREINRDFTRNETIKNYNKRRKQMIKDVLKKELKVIL